MRTINKPKFIGILLAIILLFICIYLFLQNNLAFFELTFIEIILISWILNKGRWEKELKREDATKWRRSKIFRVYLILFTLYSILDAYLWINRPPSLSNEPGNILNSLDFINFGFLITINLIFIVFLIWKKSPKQILSLPLLLIITFTIPIIVLGINFQLWNVFIKNYIFAVLPLLQLIWLYYVRFIFLKKRESAL